MNLWVSRLPVSMVRKVVGTHCQDQIRELVNAHCVADFQVNIRALICQVRNNNLRFLNKADNLAL